MPTLVALLVCLIPTTIGALLAAIGIAGMDRALRANIIAKSGKSVEVAGDVDTLLLDKTGTITVGNRRATQFVPFEGYTAVEVGRLAAQASAADQTPEGKSIVDLFYQLGDAGKGDAPRFPDRPAGRWRKWRPEGFREPGGWRPMPTAWPPTARASSPLPPRRG